MANKFKKLVIIDNIILFQEHVDQLKQLADTIVWRKTSFGSSDKESPIVPQTFLDGPACSLEVGYEKPTLDELIRIARDADAILTCWTPIPNELIDHCDNLKYIGFWTNLYTHRINEGYAKQKGIDIDYLPDYGTDSVAEFVFAGLMELGRKTSSKYSETKRGKWSYENLKKGGKNILNIDEIQEWTLKGKKLGIVGLGRIGSRVLEIAKYGYKMEVGYNSRTRKAKIEDKGVEFMDLNTLFSWADIVTCHLPPDAPKKMIGNDLFKLLRPESIFINTGSGHAVDQEALIEHLKMGDFIAFLDVYEGVPPRKDLKDLPNVLFTYRAAWFTKQAISFKANDLITKMRSNLNNYDQ